MRKSGRPSLREFDISLPHSPRSLSTDDGSRREDRRNWRDLNWSSERILPLLRVPEYRTDLLEGAVLSLVRSILVSTDCPDRLTDLTSQSQFSSSTAFVDFCLSLPALPPSSAKHDELVPYTLFSLLSSLLALSKAHFSSNRIFVPLLATLASLAEAGCLDEVAADEAEEGGKVLRDLVGVAVNGVGNMKSSARLTGAMKVYVRSVFLLMCSLLTYRRQCHRVLAAPARRSLSRYTVTPLPRASASLGTLTLFLPFTSRTCETDESSFTAVTPADRRRALRRPRRDRERRRRVVNDAGGDKLVRRSLPPLNRSSGAHSLICRLQDQSQPGRSDGKGTSGWREGQDSCRAFGRIDTQSTRTCATLALLLASLCAEPSETKNPPSNARLGYRLRRDDLGALAGAASSFFTVFAVLRVPFFAGVEMPASLEAGVESCRSLAFDARERRLEDGRERMAAAGESNES